MRSLLYAENPHILGTESELQAEWQLAELLGDRQGFLRGDGHPTQQMNVVFVDRRKRLRPSARGEAELIGKINQRCDLLLGTAFAECFSNGPE